LPGGTQFGAASAALARVIAAQAASSAFLMVMSSLPF
jgi:hypothetical protein